MLLRFLAGPAAAMALLGLAVSARSQETEEEPNPTVEMEFDFVSDYRFRGISASDGFAAGQAEIRLEYDPGVYVTAFASTLPERLGYGAFELDLYAGWTGEIALGTSFDLGVGYYLYPFADAAAGPTNFFEPYASITQEIGPVEATLGFAYAFAQPALDYDDSVYLWGEVSYEIADTPLSLTARAGHTSGSLAPDGRYWDWSVGAEFTEGPVRVRLEYVDTNLVEEPGADAAILLTIGLAF